MIYAHSEHEYIPRFLNYLMAHLPRFILPDHPPYLIQRENNHEIIFCDDEDYHYVELHPVRDGRVGHPSRYPWPRYRYIVLGQSDKLLTKHDLYRQRARV
jgi:hypothetical protein